MTASGSRPVGATGTRQTVLVTGSPGSGRRTLTAALAAAAPRMRLADGTAEQTQRGEHTVVHVTRRLDRIASAAVAAVTGSGCSTVLVLSRADEIGGARATALVSAAEVADRWATRPEVQCAGVPVVAVAGLLAVAPATLTTADLSALDVLAGLPSCVVEDLLLIPGALDTALAQDGRGMLEGRELVARLGVFGVRLAVSLLREGAADRSSLGGELRRRSGLLDLLGVLERSAARSPADLQPPAHRREDDGEERDDQHPGAGEEGDLVGPRAAAHDIGGDDGRGRPDATEDPQDPPRPRPTAQQEDQADGPHDRAGGDGAQGKQQRGRHARPEGRRGRLRVLLGGQGQQPGT